MKSHSRNVATVAGGGHGPRNGRGRAGDVIVAALLHTSARSAPDIMLVRDYEEMRRMNGMNT